MLTDKTRHDTTKLTVALRNFAKRPTKYQSASAIPYVTSHEGNNLTCYFTKATVSGIEHMLGDLQHLKNVCLNSTLIYFIFFLAFSDGRVVSAPQS